MTKGTQLQGWGGGVKNTKNGGSGIGTGLRRLRMVVGVNLCTLVREVLLLFLLCKESKLLLFFSLGKEYKFSTRHSRKGSEFLFQPE